MKSTATKHTVLYAEDDEDDRELVREALEVYSEHVAVVTVPDGEAVLSYLKHLPREQPAPCLIILDINMPKMDGREALVHLRRMERFSLVPVLLFSTSSQPQDAQFARKYGAGFMTKPLDGRRLEVVADQFIEHCTEEVRKSLQGKLL